ncbi:MAG: TIGR04283 family arsenosugar biosynthesis glycosyltransferase [Planctomycetia bacterium]|nr:TIGR04283 family arsenosugar biosynthesis glycosyltransferase [Planctomycetia bacterium]
MPPLPIAAIAPATRPARSAGPLSLAVVIPALDEESSIEAAVASAWNAGADEVVVADGGSTDATRERAAAVARVVSAPRGRASQMNAGAAAATADVLLFLHADSRLPQNAAALVRDALADPLVGAGAFRVRFDAPGPFWRVVTSLTLARARLCGITLGDQALFARRDSFRRLAGFREIPILEDLDFADRARRAARFRILRADVLTSTRRWRRRGLLRTSAANWAILLLYRLGAPPGSLARLYR